MKKAALLLFSALLVSIACGCVPGFLAAHPGQNQIDLSEWNKVGLGLGFLTYRRPLVAVTAQGPTKFVVAAVRPIDSTATGESASIGGTLIFHEFDLSTGFQESPITVSTNSVGFVRGSMNPPITADCDPVVATSNSSKSLNDYTQKIGEVNGSSKASNFNIAGNQGYVNYLTFDEMSDSRANGDVKLTSLLSCPGQRTKISTVVVDQGKRPSLAVGKDENGEEKILVAYGSKAADSRLMGRFYTLAAAPLGPPFVIFNYTMEFRDWDTLSTDVIWNPVSKRFIVGFTPKRIHPFFTGMVLNITVDFDGNAGDVVRHGGGVERKIHTWVDIDRRQSENPDGFYAWYFSDGDERNIRLMDNLGRPTGEETWIHFPNEILGSAMFGAAPFAALRNVNQDSSRPALLSTGGFSDQYVTALTHRSNPNEGHEDIPLKIMTFSKDGKLKAHPSPELGGARLRGIGALENHTVYIHSVKHASLQNTTNLFLTVRKNSDPPVFE